ncbi:MAG: prephenate dehydratase [Thermomicrobiales bacterium]|nr:prephenate dehydratase [Thermomicrobiales bacterium]
MSIAFLGPRGTFSEDAAILHGGENSSRTPFASIPALTEAVETGLCTEAVLPIENSIEGAIAVTLDLLIHQTPLKISAEVMVPVRHFLVTAPGAELSQITTVMSHPQGLGQCRKFLEQCLPNAAQIASLSTAGAVEEVATSTDLTKAAIGPGRAAALYGGQVLASDIQDVHTNVTRFVVLAAEDRPPTGRDKTSLCFTVKKNIPGILAAVLEPFARAGIQLTKLESRPTKLWLFEYVFLLDFLGHHQDEPVARAIAELTDLCEMVKVFGSYPAFPVETLGFLGDFSRSANRPADA